MDTTRREFVASALFSSGMALGALGGLAGCKNSSPAVPSETAPPFDHRLLQFWSQSVRDTAYAPRAAQALADASAANSLGSKLPRTPDQEDADRLPVFYIWTETQGIRRADAVTEAELMNPGDVSVAYKLNSLKASAADQQHKVQAGNLRFDVRQAHTLPNFSEPLSWSTISALALHDSKLPPFIKDIVDPKEFWGGTPTVILPGGVGYWAYNLFVQERPHLGIFDQLFQLLRSGTEAVGLIATLGIPAVSLTAVHALDTMYGAMNAFDAVRTHNVYKTADVPIAATKDGLQKGELLSSVSDQKPLPLRSGRYIAVPWSHTEDFERAKDRLTLVDGYLVGHDMANASGPALEEAAIGDSDLANVTYLSFGVVVSPASVTPAPGVGHPAGGPVHSKGGASAPNTSPSKGNQSPVGNKPAKPSH